MNAGALVVAIVGTLGILLVVLVSMIAINHLAVRLRRANRKVRLLHLWARERRAGLARLVSLWITVDELAMISAGSWLDNFEEELKKQARYVGVEWGRIPTPAPGFMYPEKLTPAELLVLLDLACDVGNLGVSRETGGRLP